MYHITYADDEFPVEGSSNGTKQKVRKAGLAANGMSAGKECTGSKIETKRKSLKRARNNDEDATPSQCVSLSGNPVDLTAGRQRWKTPNTPSRVRSVDVLPDDVERSTDVINTVEREALAEQNRLIGSGFSSHSLEELVRCIVRHIIFHNANHPDVPISREDLSKIVSENYKGRRKRAGFASSVIAMARLSLAKAFGLHLVEFQRYGKNSDKKVYVLRSLVPHSLHSALINNERKKNELGFLSAVLGLIYVSGGKISEGNY